MTAAPPPLLKRAVTARGPFVMPFHDHVTTLSDAGCQTPSLTEEHLNMRIWRHRSVRTLTALVATGALAVAASSTASADLVVNGVDDSVDSTVELMPLALGGAPGRTTIYVVVSDTVDTDEGCNFDGPNETLTVNIASDNPAVATVSPSTLVLSACGPGGGQPVTVTPVGVGSATMVTTLAPFGNKTGGVFHYANSSFTAKVTAVANTPPTLEVVGVNDGGTYVRGELARPECVATDVDDFPTPPHTKTWLAPLTEIEGPYKVDNIGTRYAMCSYVDGSGAQVLASKGWSIVDETAPVISRVVDPAAVSGWFRGDVSLDWTVTEAQSPSSLKTTGCEDQIVTSDTPLTVFTCAATSAGGNNNNTINIRRDATPPSVSPTSTLGGAGPLVGGWYTSPVDVTFTATDETSRFLVDDRAVVTTSQTVRTSGDGELTVKSPAFTDRAGNSSAVGAQSRTVKVDATPPNAPSTSLSTDAGGTGWHTDPVTVTFAPEGDNEGSGVATCTTPVTIDVDTAGQTVSGTCTDNVGHVSDATEVTVKLDRGAPVVTETVVASGTAGQNEWYTSDVDVQFTATDPLSGLDSATQTVRSSGEGAAVEVSSPAFTDRAGNTTTPAGAVTKIFKIDKTAPVVPTFVGGPSGSVYFGDAVAVPTCTSSDSGSGLFSCAVTGGGSTVGAHAWTATATDNAGHTSTATLAYEVVVPWSTKGFTAPVDMGGVFNTVKGGSTVPVKFELFDGTKELIDTGLVKLSASKVPCSSAGQVDDIEVLASGSTVLRYDTAAGQFQYNWKLPTGAGTCYELKMSPEGGRDVTALFKLK